MITTIHPESRSRPVAGGTAVVVSVVLHAGVAIALLLGVRAGRVVDFSSLMPALYLYAPDRQPSEPREMRVPIPEEMGHMFGVDAPVAQALPGGLVHARPAPPKGRLPAGRPSARIDSVFSALAVDSEVVRYPSSVPIYPDRLLAQGIEGAVDAEFVVDTTGLVDLGSVRILTSTHEDFTASVRAALAGALFRPAWRDQHKVRQLVRQRFAFRLYRGPAPESVAM